MGEGYLCWPCSIAFWAGGTIARVWWTWVGRTHETMGDADGAWVQIELERIFRAESRYALASLIRIVGDFHLAEESLQAAFVAAAEKWPVEGVPKNPRSWLISTARFKAIDRIRRERNTVSGLDAAEFSSSTSLEIEQIVEEEIQDDLLRLIFMCCHPTLPIEAQVALTLREVCQLKTDEIARAFLLSEPTMAQRISRAKSKLRQVGAVLESPLGDELEAHLGSVLRVIYLVFNEGYYTSSGESLTSSDLSGEAVRLGELLAQLLPHPEVFGLSALMCLSESRRAARERNGEIILLEDQDRSTWDHDLIAKGNRYLALSQESAPAGYYALQALIAAEHANAKGTSETNWARIVELYDLLAAWSASPVVLLNRAVALAMSGEIEDGLEQITALIENEQLSGYGLAHAARADLLRRQGNLPEARSAYEMALSLSQMAPERHFLEKRIREIDAMSRS